MESSTRYDNGLKVVEEHEFTMGDGTPVRIRRVEIEEDVPTHKVKLWMNELSSDRKKIHYVYKMPEIIGNFYVLYDMTGRYMYNIDSVKKISIKRVEMDDI